MLAAWLLGASQLVGWSTIFIHETDLKKRVDPYHRRWPMLCVCVKGIVGHLGNVLPCRELDKEFYSKFFFLCQLEPGGDYLLVD